MVPPRTNSGDHAATSVNDPPDTRAARLEEFIARARERAILDHRDADEILGYDDHGCLDELHRAGHIGAAVDPSG